jgi:hypothetical protein
VVLCASGHVLQRWLHAQLCNIAQYTQGWRGLEVPVGVEGQWTRCSRDGFTLACGCGAILQGGLHLQLVEHESNLRVAVMRSVTFLKQKYLVIRLSASGRATVPEGVLTDAVPCSTSAWTNKQYSPCAS